MMLSLVVLVLVVCAGCSALSVLSCLPALAVSCAPASSFRVSGGREGGDRGLTPDSDPRPFNLGCLVMGLPWDPAAETRIQIIISIDM